jgi:hypothetical protein
MRLDFQHVLTRKRVRRWKPQGQPVVDGLALGIGKREVSGFTGAKGAA